MELLEVVRLVIIRALLPDSRQLGCGQGHLEVLAKASEALQTEHNQVLVLLCEVAPDCSELATVEVEHFQQIVLDDLLAVIRQLGWWYHVVGILLCVLRLRWLFTLAGCSLTEWIYRHCRWLLALDRLSRGDRGLVDTRLASFVIVLFE